MPQLHEHDLLTREVLAWKGLHLFHYPMSSCSQKLRIFLNLKAVAWEPHVIDLSKQENNRDWFMGINPRGLVPVLVDDGQVHIESNDILRHLEHRYPDPALIPPADAVEIDRYLKAEDDLHLALRTLSFRFVYGRSGSTKSPEALAGMKQAGSGRVQGVADEGRAKEVAFYERIGQQGLSDSLCQVAFEKFRRAFDEFDVGLRASPFLLGEVLTVLDIAWYVYAFRLDLGGYPLDQLHPNVYGWYKALDRRETFRKEVAPPPAVQDVIARSLRDQHASGRAFAQVIRL